VHPQASVSPKRCPATTPIASRPRQRREVKAAEQEQAPGSMAAELVKPGYDGGRGSVHLGDVG